MTDPSARSKAGSADATADLVRAATRGDRERFGELCSRLAPALHAWARLRVHPALRSRLDAEDLVQETWGRVIEGLASYDPDAAPFRAWVFGVANRVLARALRRLREKPATDALKSPASATSPGLAAFADDATSISRRVAREETLRVAVDRCLLLDEPDLRLLAQHGLEGRTLVELAPQFGTGVEALKKRWQRLRARLEADGLSALLADA